MEQNMLVLDILKQEDALEMSIFEQEEFASTVRHYNRPAFTFKEVKRISLEITSILNRANQKGLLESELSNNLKEKGKLLWDQLLTRSVKERLKTTIIRNLVLSLDEDLVDIPWELLYDGDNFLSLKFNLGRLIRAKDDKVTTQYRPLAEKPRMLILANPTNDLKSAYNEGTFIKKEFDKKRGQIAIDFKSTHIDTLYVKKNLREYDIVHFAGHSEFDPCNPKDSGWILSDGKFSVHDIMQMAYDLELPNLIFSNACQSAHNFASALLFSGVRHYIGTIRRIEDPVSLSFSKEFYTQLIKGSSVGGSVTLARKVLIREYGINSVFWASYLLYGDPNFVLFNQKSKLKTAGFKRGPSWHKKRIITSVSILFFAFISIYLFILLPEINPNSFFLFTKSRRLFTQGKNQEVISISANLIKKEPLFLPAYPLIADAYQRLGDRDTALKYYFDYARYSDKRRANNHLASAYIGIGWVYQAQGENSKAFDFYNRALNLARENNDRLNEAVSLRKLAVWHIDSGQYDKALELLTKSSEINRERSRIYKYRYNLACDYFDIGLVFVNKEDFVTAREFYARSLRLFERMKLKNELSDYYFNQGEVYLFEKQYQKALDFYMRGLDIDKRQANLPNIASDYDMIGELYIETGDLEKAEESFNEALSVSKQINGLPELASSYYNLGLLYKQKRQKNKAREYLRQAQELYYSINKQAYQEIRQELLELAN